MIYTTLFLLILIFFLTLLCVFFSWSRLARIYYKNHSFFDILFILLYPFEEIMFLLFYYLIPQLRNLWVALIIILICCTVIIDKWLLKKQHARVLKISAIKRERRKQKQIERFKKFERHVLTLEKEKEDLINYALKKIKKTKSK